MVETVKNVNTTQQKPPETFNLYNAPRNAAIGAGLGLVGTGTVGYMTKSFVDGDKLSDQFIKEVKKQFVDIHTPNPIGKKLYKDFLNLKEELNFVDIKNFLKNNRTIVEASFNESVEEIISYPPKAMYYFGELKSDFNQNIKQVLDRFPAMIESMFDKDKKKFIFNAKNSTTGPLSISPTCAESVCNAQNTPLGKSIISAERKIRGAQAFKWGAIGGLVAGSTAFIATKFAPKKQA